jgi:putative Ca2+/H+ antiporter (TMEM165/GDT1 family)
VEVASVPCLAPSLATPSTTVGSGIDLALFLSVFAITFVAELPDKTAFAALILATRAHPVAIFIGAAGAFVVQSLIAVTCGSLVGLLPPSLIQVGSGLVFIALGLVMWFRRDHEEDELDLEKTRGKFLRTIWVSFVVIFIAEWGDLTQFSTAILAAKHGPGKAVTVFVAATLALWTVTALAILVGNRARKILQPKVLQRIAAVAFAVVGVALLLGLGFREH